VQGSGFHPEYLKTTAFCGSRCSSVLEGLPCIYRALGSIPGTAKEKQKEQAFVHQKTLSRERKQPTEWEKNLQMIYLIWNLLCTTHKELYLKNKKKY
jgi:hypothetical protein